jgi:hypothetical protein
MNSKTIKLTEEYKEKLKGILGFDVLSEFKYVPISFRKNGIPKELWPIFTLTSKDGIELAEVEDCMGEVSYNTKDNSTSFKISSGAQRVKTLEIGIKKVNRYIMEDGNFLCYDSEKQEITIGEKKSTNITSRDFIRYLPINLQIELQNAINERKNLSEEELTGLE